MAIGPAGYNNMRFPGYRHGDMNTPYRQKSTKKQPTNKQQKTPTNNTKDKVQQYKMLSLEYFLFQVNKTTVTRMNFAYRNTRATLNAEIPWAT